MNKKLYRSTSNKMLGGVCGGLADYLDLDPTLVRIFFVILMIASGVGLLIYVVMWAILPRQDQLDSSAIPSSADGFADRAREMGNEFREAVRTPNKNAGMFIGIALVVVGIVAFIDQLNIQWLHWVRSDMIWALLLVAGGVALLVRALRKE